MARVLASRATSDEALQKQLDRAAARFSSIHDRWSAITDPSSAAAAPSERAALGAAARRASPFPALSASESGVCVTPILGIATSSDDEPRPRFKTLMGVPRDDPDGDEQATFGEELAIDRECASTDAERAALAPLRRPPPLPSRFLGISEAAPSPLAAAADALQAVPAPTRTMPPGQWPPGQWPSGQWPSVVPATPDIATDLAMLRKSQRLRSWLVGVGSFAATLAVFSLAAPRERTLAWRWLRDELQARFQPSFPAVTDTAQALNPSVVQPVDGISSGERTGWASTAAERQHSEEQRPLDDVVPGPDLDIATTVLGAAPAMEVASDPELAPPSEPTAPSLPVTSHEPPMRSTAATEGSSPPPRRAARAKHAAASQPKAQVAAPRKRSTRAAGGASAAGKDAAGNKARGKEAGGDDRKPRAAASVKERAARQNSPRRRGNGGIIRETPF